MSVSVVPTPEPARSLEWQGEYLADPVGLFRRWQVEDGTLVRESGISYGRLVDSLVVSPSGRYRVLYTRRGTKGIVLDGRKGLREVNRSYSHAEDYDYPVALGRLPDGREVLAHCPDRSGCLRIEDVATGEILADQPHPGHTYFHSRLAFSPDGRHLLVNGWYWHPEATVAVHDVAAAIADPRTLDGNLLRRQGGGGVWRGEVVSACWLNADQIAVLETTSSFEEAILEDGDEEERAEARYAGTDTLAVLGVDATVHARNRIAVTPGLLVPCGSLLMNLHTRPSLVDPADGRTVAQWPELAAGSTARCYGVPVPDSRRYPVYSYEPSSRRLALAQDDHIALLDIPRGDDRHRP